MKLELSMLVKSVMEQKLSLKSSQAMLRVINSEIGNVAPTSLTNAAILRESDLRTGVCGALKSHQKLALGVGLGVRQRQGNGSAISNAINLR